MEAARGTPLKKEKQESKRMREEVILRNPGDVKHEQVGGERSLANRSLLFASYRAETAKKRSAQL